MSDSLAGNDAVPFEQACATSQESQRSRIRSESPSTSILYVCEKKRLLCECAYVQTRLTVGCSPMRYVPKSYNCWPQQGCYDSKYNLAST